MAKAVKTLIPEGPLDFTYQQTATVGDMHGWDYTLPAAVDAPAVPKSKHVLDMYKGDRHILEYFGPWCILEEQFRCAVDQATGINLQLHVEEHRAANGAGRRDDPDFVVTEEGVAVIELTGPLMKFGSSFNTGGSTVRARREVRQAAAMANVNAILLKIDSPGGTVAGTFDLVDDIRDAAAQKTVWAYVEDLGASAAYAISSGATRIFANPTALVGSIGTFAVITDASVMAEKLGVKVHVVKAGEFKGAATPGTEVTEEQLDNFQRIVNDLNEEFIRAVSRGRGMTIGQVRDLADGRVHIAAEAMRLGLIDGVQSFDATLQQLTTNFRGNGGNVMTTEQTAATLQDIKGACPGAESEFIVSQLEASATLDEVRTAWTAELQSRLAAKDEELEAAKAEANKPGVDPLGGGNPNKRSSGGEFGGGSKEEFFDKVDQCVKETGVNRQKAFTIVAKRYPELRQAMVDEANVGRVAAR